MKFKKIISMILCCVMLMSLTVNVSAATSGSCGTNATYSWDYLWGKIVISGTGPMYDKMGDWCENPRLVESVEIRSGITRIGKYSFDYCEYMTEFSMADSVTSIGAGAFNHCEKLQSIELSSGVTTIEMNAFSYCEGLKSIRIPKNLQSVDMFAFTHCDSLTDVYYEGSRSEWDNIDIDSLGNSALTNATIHCEGKENLTGVTFSNKTVTYDGTEKSISVSGAPSGATVTYTSDDTTENKATDAGTYNIKATVSKSGYNDKVLNATLTISKKDLTVSGLVAKDKPYDATANADIDTTNGSLVGVISGDDVTPTFPENGTFASINAGDNIAVSFSPITISGADKDNYNLIQPTLKANITKLPIKIKADNKEVVKGGTLPELTYTISEDTKNNFVGDDKESGTLATNANVNVVDNYDITIGTLSVPANYELTFTKGTLSVIDKTPQISFYQKFQAQKLMVIQDLQ